MFNLREHVKSVVIMGTNETNQSVQRIKELMEPRMQRVGIPRMVGMRAGTQIQKVGIVEILGTRDLIVLRERRPTKCLRVHQSLQ